MAPTRNSSTTGSSRRLIVGMRIGARRLDRVEQIVEPRRERRHLDLLESHADERPALARLEVERAIARLTDRAGHESIGFIEDEEASCHATHPTGSRDG